MTAVRLVITQMDPTLAHVTAASLGMDEPVEVQAFLINTEYYKRQLFKAFRKIRLSGHR